MAKRLAGVTVLEGTKLKWGTVAGIFLSVPAYAVTHGISRTVQLFYAALDWLVTGPFSFAAQALDIVFGDATLGIRMANLSFANAIQGAGILAPIFAGAGTVLSAYLIYRGVMALG